MRRGGAEGLEGIKDLTLPLPRNLNFSVLPFADGIHHGTRLNLQATIVGGVLCRLVVTVEHFGRGLDLVFVVSTLFRRFRLFNALYQFGKGVAVRNGTLAIRTKARSKRSGKEKPRRKSRSRIFPLYGDRCIHSQINRDQAANFKSRTRQVPLRRQLRVTKSIFKQHVLIRHVRYRHVGVCSLIRLFRGATYQTRVLRSRVTSSRCCLLVVEERRHFGEHVTRHS